MIQITPTLFESSQVVWVLVAPKLTALRTSKIFITVSFTQPYLNVSYPFKSGEVAWVLVTLKCAA